MIFALFILGCFFVFAVFCGLAILGYRHRAHSAEARANRAEGALDESRGHVEAFRSLAEKAIVAAAEASGIQQDELWYRCETGNCGSGDCARCAEELARQAAEQKRRFNTLQTQLEQQQAEETQMRGFVAPVVAFCPSCSVSVRRDPADYPVKCPRAGCGTLIDPVLDNPPELT